MMCTSGTVDMLFIIVFVSNNILVLSVSLVCTSGTVDILFIIVFVSNNIVSILGQSGVYLRFK